MWRMSPAAAAALLIASATLPTAAARPTTPCTDTRDGRHHLSVRIVPGSMDSVVLARVRAEVEAIWSRYQIAIVWPPLWESDQQPLPDVWVQFVDAPLPPAGGDGRAALARLAFDDGVPTSRIVVSSATAAALLAVTPWGEHRGALVDGPVRLRTDALGRIVGRAVAHELGHYLLRSSAHTERGLMRAALAPKELVSPDSPFMTLDAAELHELRKARLVRCAPLR